MTKWYYSENGERRGPICQQTFESRIEHGTIMPETLVWRAGMPEWKLLRNIDFDQEFSAPTSSEVPPIPIRSRAVEINVDQLNEAGEFRTGPAWERRSKIGFFKALFRTVSAVLFEPGPTFSRMKRTGGFANPAFYFVLIFTLSTWAAIGYRIAGFVALSTDYLQPVTHPKLSTTIALFLLQNWLSVCVAVPLTAILALFLLTILFHLTLKIFGASYSFQTTFRTLAYTLGSIVFFQFIPILKCGDILMLVWFFPLLILGFTKMQRISIPKAIAVVVVLPLLIGGASVIYFQPDAPAAKTVSAEKTPLR